ncbi:MAG: PEGA domain-containing protein, partial [Planctomycetota bacterium]
MRNKGAFSWGPSALLLCLAVLAACASETQTDPLPAQTQPARLAVVAFPAAEVSLDGKLVGTTPVAGLEVTPGKHAVTLRRDGFEDLVLDVDLAEGEERRLDE